MSGRYVVRRELPVLWTILDTYTRTTELVLFGEGVGNYVRYFVADELMEHRDQVLREMVWHARRAGIRHTLRLPNYPTSTMAPANPRQPYPSML